MPVVVEVSAVDDLGRGSCPRGRIDQLETLTLAQVVHVRLKRDEPGRLVENGVAVATRHGAGWDVEWGGRLRELPRPSDVLGCVALRVQHEPELDFRFGRLTDGVKVITQTSLLAFLEQHTRALGIDLRVFALGVLDQELAAITHGAALSPVDRVGQRVMHHLVRRTRRRTRLDRLDVSVLVDRDVSEQFAEQVGAGGGHVISRELDDEIWRADLPGARLGELPGSREVCRVALGRPGIDPFHDCFDLAVGQRWIVLEFRNADRLVDMPWRHGSRGHLGFD